jgi:photosystem II stability/assembly factor-like uncharacterized protein
MSATASPASAIKPTRIFAGGAYYKTRIHNFKGGLFRTTPERGEWETLTKGLPENPEARVVRFHPTDPDVVYAGTQDGVYRSLDGGDTWQRTGFPEKGAIVWSLVFHPANPKIMFAGLAPVGVYRSDDGGDTWRKLTNATTPEYCPMGFPTRTIGIAIDPLKADDLYVALEVSGVIHSRDGGETFTDVTAPLIKLSEDHPHLKSRLDSHTDASGMLDSHAIVMSAAAPGRAILGVRMGLFSTDDHGASWQDMQVGKDSPLTYCRTVMVSPHDPNTLFAGLSVSSRGNDGSLYRSRDCGKSWKRYDHGVTAHATMMYAAQHPRDAARVYCVSRCGEVFGTEDDGQSWRTYKLPDGVQDVYTVACG